VRKSLFDRSEFHETTENSSELIHVRVSASIGVLQSGSLIDGFLYLNVELSVLSLVLAKEVFKIVVDRVQEGVDFLKRRFGQLFDLANFLVNHGGQFSSLVLVLLGDEVQFVKEDLADLAKLLSGESEILVRLGHAEVRIDKVD